MGTQVIVLNGGSSSGKTGVARCLQAVLPEPWLTVGVDVFIDALPASLRLPGAGAPAVGDPGAGEGRRGGGIAIDAAGGVTVDDEFRRLEDAWNAGVAAMARAGARLVVDDVFLGGARSQERLRAHLAGLDVLWVGVRCAPEVATMREVARGDRVPGMAADQAERVHDGVAYDVEVDTATTESLDCARAVAAHVT